MIDIAPDILKQAAQGDLGAFEQVYKAASGFIYNVAFRITRNNADAEEVTQDVFMKIYHNLKGFQFRSAFKTWIYRIAVNTAINRYRQSSREVKKRVDYDTVIDTLPSDRAPVGELVQKDNEAKVSALLDKLSPKYKTCLILRELEGLSYQEIAAVLYIPVNTVRSRLKRAREALLIVAGHIDSGRG